MKMRWMLTALAVVFMTLLASPALSTDTVAETTDLTAAPTVPAPEKAEVVVEDQPAVFEGFADVLDELAAPPRAEASCCQDQCRRDKQCDTICGAPGAGVCLQVNSCCRECACTF